MYTVKILESGLYNAHFCGDVAIVGSNKDELVSATIDYIKSCEIKDDSTHDFYLFDEDAKRVGWFTLRSDGSVVIESWKI